MSRIWTVCTAQLLGDKIECGSQQLRQASNTGLVHGLQSMRRAVEEAWLEAESHQFPAFNYRLWRTLNAEGRVTGKSTNGTWKPEEQWLPAAHQAGILQ